MKGLRTAARWGYFPFNGNLMIALVPFLVDGMFEILSEKATVGILFEKCKSSLQIPTIRSHGRHDPN